MLLSVETQRHFDDAPGKVVQDCFSQIRAMSSWATVCCFRGCSLFTRNGTWFRLLARSCSLVRVFEQRLFTLAHWMPLLCVPWLQRTLTELYDVAVQAWGLYSKAFVILSPTRAILAHHSNEIHRKLLSLAHAIGWNDGRLCCRCSHRLFANFGMWRLYRVCCLSLLLRGKNFLWL